MTNNAPLFWARTPQEIESLSTELIERSRQRVDSFVKLPVDQLEVQDVLKQFAEEDADYDTTRTLCEFPKDVSASKQVREASNDAAQRLRRYDVEKATRKDVYDVLVKLEAKKATLQPEWQRYLDRLLRDKRRLGLHLPEEQRTKIKELQEEMSKLSLDFSKNLSEENSSFLFTEEELVGVPSDVLAGFEAVEENGVQKRRVTLKYPDYFPVAKNARNPDTRRKLQTAFDSRCVDTNVPILETLVKKRAEMAKILGYPSHAAYILTIRMASSPENVDKFLTDLNRRLEPLARKEMDALLALKKAECEQHNLPFDGVINAYDFRYYVDKYEKSHYKVSDKVKEYFPMPHVLKGMLEIYQTLLGLVFRKLPKASDQVWHEDVDVYEVEDAATKVHMGYFYLDLHPREGKYGHAACFGLRPGCVRADGQRQTPATAMVANFSRGVDGKPALMQHDEVETLFHEFGHVMHRICAQAVISMFSGTSVERDFVEAPSQEKESLFKMSAHYETGAAMPDEIFQPLLSARYAMNALLNKRQLLLALFDQYIHTHDEADVGAVFARLSKEIWNISATPGTNMPGTFGHMVGYDSQYYGYLWSEVFSMDMFMSRFKAEGILNPQVGMSYRKNILEPGGSKDASDMLRAFLGRDPQPDAFLKSRGLAEENAHL